MCCVARFDVLLRESLWDEARGAVHGLMRLWAYSGRWRLRTEHSDESCLWYSGFQYDVVYRSSEGLLRVCCMLLSLECSVGKLLLPSKALRRRNTSLVI